MVKIGPRRVGPGEPCFLIAEAGVNHNGDLELALRLVDAAAKAGADAIKFQTFRAERVTTALAPKAAYQADATGIGGSQLKLLRGLELEADAFAVLKRAAESRGLVFLSTPFDEESVGELDRMGVAALKVASPDVTNLLLLRAIGARGRPIILSTGLADLAEVELAVEALRGAGGKDLVMLHCVSEYPAPAEGVNLRAMATLESRFDVPVGFSDHTEGTEVALAAAALGAAVLEKHFTLDRDLPGPDHRVSLEPDELAALVVQLRRVEAALGNGVKVPTAGERRNAPAVRRSLAAVADLQVGTVLELAMLTALRPGTGISPACVDEVVGRRLRRAVCRNELLHADDLE